MASDVASSGVGEMEAVVLGRGSPWCHARKILRFNFENKLKNKLKEQYVNYLFNTTSQILYFTEEQDSISCSKVKKLDFLN